jgi:predicted nucleic acid-binding protein
VKFLDTNIILRYLVRDDESKADACFALFQRVNNAEEEITTCGAVIVEAVYVLSSPRTHGVPRERVRDLLRPILTMPGLRLSRKRLYLLALDLFVTYPRLDFEDALIIAHMREAGIDEVLSYDEDFDPVSDVFLSEPIG